MHNMYQLRCQGILNQVAFNFSSTSIWDHVGMCLTLSSITHHFPFIIKDWALKNRWDIESEPLMQRGQVDEPMIFFLYHVYVEKGFLSMRKYVRSL